MAEKVKVYDSPEQSGKTAAAQPERVKIYDQKKSGFPMWKWLLPLLLAIAVGTWLLNQQHTAPEMATVTTPQSLGSINFDTDQAVLTADSRATLDRASEMMKQKPDMRLRIQGFTDSTGDAAHNVALSNQRSDAVNQYLGSKGVDRSRLTSEGFGDAKPVATNATAGGKAENRRVELFQQ